MGLAAADAPSFDPRTRAHRRPGLDFLRALAILLVFPYHAGLFGFTIPGDVQRFGWIGVDLFFVLSGYLIGGQLLAAIARGRKVDLGGFFWRRALRILPAYLVVVAVYFLLPVEARDYAKGPPAWAFLTFTQNFGLRGGTWFSHAWSLCIEFQFYVLLPFIVIGLSRSARVSAVVLLGILVGEPIVRGMLAHANPTASFGWWQQWVYYPTFSRLDGLTIGVALAGIELFRPKWWAALMKMTPWLWIIGLAAIALALWLAEDGLSVTSSSVGFSLVAFGAGTWLLAAVSPRLPLSRVAIPGAAFVATIAYSIYLSHKLAIHAVRALTDRCAFPAVIGYLAMLAAVFLAGTLLFFAVERPFLRVREKR